MAGDDQGAGGPVPADQQQRTKLDATDPNQTNKGSNAGEQDPAVKETGESPAAKPTEQESGAGYGNHATGYEDA